jgi:hypothetical protein
MVFGRGAFPEPTQFQVTTAARLLDKSLTEWDSAWHQFAEHSATRGAFQTRFFRASRASPAPSFRPLTTWRLSLTRLIDCFGWSVPSNKPSSSGSSRVCRCPRVTSASVFDSFATASLTATRTSSAGWAGPRYRDLPTRCRRDRTATAQARVIWPACSNRFTTTCGRLSKSRHSDGLPRTSAPATGISSPVAEGVGFEPTVDQTAHNGFRDRPVQPLRHPSEWLPSG